MTEPVLALERVSYAYPGASAQALREITLSVYPGEVVVVAGDSGSGKSSLLQVASGLVPHFHGGSFAGRARVAGLDTREHGPGDLAAHVGSVFQDPETQIVMGSVRAELAFGLENAGAAPGAVARGVEETALALGVAPLLDRPTAELSGGELQRVALAAALAPRPALLVLDEPTSQLDPVAGDELISILRRLNDDAETTILLAEHRLERCLGLADRVIALDHGSVTCDAGPGEFLSWALTHAPELATPGARLLGGLGLSPVPGVRRARRALREAGMSESGTDSGTAAKPGGAAVPRKSSRTAALTLDRVWHEVRDGPAILRGISLSIEPGERVALMGRNGAGKSTLLRHAAGLLEPSRGRVNTSGRVALLLQNPTDYLIHDTVANEAPVAARRAVGLPDSLDARHPRDLSGGEKQRLALAIVLGEPAAGDEPAVLCLDEPTRGMDRRRKAELAGLLCGIPAGVLVATHDPEFAASFAQRVVLLADGGLIADGPVAEVLTGGTYFATEAARIVPGALTAEDGVARLTRPAAEAVA